LDQNATDLTLSSSTTEGASQITAAAPNWQTTFFYNIGNTVQYTWNISAGGAGSANNPMLAGSTYVITTVGSVNWTSLGASSGALGVTFVYNGAAATGAGGQVYAIYICVLQNVASASFLSDVNAGYWEQYLVFNPLQVGSTWQLAYLQNSSYLEVDGTASGGIPNSVVTNGLSDSGQIQILGPYELHTYGVWSNNIALQRSLDNGNTWDTVRLVTGRSDRNVDISGTALQLGLYQIVVTNSAALVNPGATNPRVVLECVDSFIYSQFQMTAYETPYLASATILTQVPTPNPGATEYWSEAAWSNYRGFPEAVTSFQQRLIYGGSGYEPQRIWGTVTNDLQNFALGDQTQATDSFAFDLNAPSRGPILWILSQSNNMLVGFAGAEWVVNSGQATTSTEVSSGAITASSINAVENSTWGSAQNVDPVNTGDAALFAQRQASTIRQMQFSFYTAKFMSQDVTTLSDHLFPSGVTRLAYVTRWRRQAIVWATTQQGALLGMTYEQDQQVYGWHRHLTGYNQLDANGNPTVVNDLGFECVSCVSGTGQNDDEVWVVTNRWLANGVPTRFIERFNPVNWEEVFSGPPNPPAPVPAQAFYVDLGSTIVNPARINSGYAYLNGRYIVGLADGNPFGPVLVSAGQVVIPANLYPPSGVGLLQFGTAVGYACQPMRMDADPRAGNTQGVNKSISDLYVRVYNSAGGSVSNGTSLYPYWISGQTYSPGALVRSPANNASYYCAVLDPASSVDPSLDLMPAGHWYQAIAPTYQSPVPLVYPQNPNVPYPSPMFITTPTDIRVEPKGMPSPGMDPVIIIQGNDALPITVLALVSKYGIDSVP
jgi:hypothetical protein